MSWQSPEEPEVMATHACKALQHVIVPRPRDIGGFEVRRVLPAPERRNVGPFVFFDQMGPAELAPGSGIDVRPHPHIGLATVTYLFAGTIIHRDSLGTVQAIEPGEVNWMTAGRGIAHSERSDSELRKQRQRLYGIQIWVALPKEHEETPPDFTHYPAAALPMIEGDGNTVRLIAGSLFGKESPVKTFSKLFYAEVALQAGASVALDSQHEERAIYLVEGTIEIARQPFEPGRLLVFGSGEEITVYARSAARVLLFGGEPLDGPRHLWWNFVSSSRERIERAKADWKAKRFVPVPGDDEFIPLPEGS
ncbi:MAG TPA: pirin family protein [Terriglobales bacterium]|jgi:redox-sensitive bicupin YhaK (pirin superfamily)|nr:pirin family protein [Terriglobales bacterium]